jgi:hypothetical protein
MQCTKKQTAVDEVDAWLEKLPGDVELF